MLVDFWKQQRKFPMFALPAATINTVSAQLPVLIVASRFGTEFAGYLAMSLRLIGAPVTLLGRSVLDDDSWCAVAGAGLRRVQPATAASPGPAPGASGDRKSTRLNSSH